MNIIIIIALLGLILLVVAVRRPHPASPRGLAGLFARKCRHCRVLISGSASHCPHCGQPTGWRAMNMVDMPNREFERQIARAALQNIRRRHWYILPDGLLSAVWPYVRGPLAVAGAFTLVISPALIVWISEARAVRAGLPRERADTAHRCAAMRRRQFQNYRASSAHQDGRARHIPVSKCQGSNRCLIPTSIFFSC